MKTAWLQSTAGMQSNAADDAWRGGAAEHMRPRHRPRPRKHAGAAQSAVSSNRGMFALPFVDDDDGDDDEDDD